MEGKTPTSEQVVGMGRAENVHVQMNMIRFTKENTAIKVVIVGRGGIRYTNGKMTKPSENDVN